MVYWYNGVMSPAIWNGEDLIYDRLGIRYKGFLSVFGKNTRWFFANILYKNGMIMQSPQSPLVFSKKLHKATIHYTNLAV